MLGLPQPSIGQFSIYHVTGSSGYTAREVNRRPCTELPERQASLDAYWTPRLGYSYTKLRETAICVDDVDIYL